MIEIIKNGFLELGIPCDNIDKQILFCKLLLEKNKVMNLTAIKEPEKVANMHILDSVIILKYYDLAHKNVIDIGCGAGFPSMPIKIAQDTVHMTFLDSLAKRINFIEETCQTMGIKNYKALHARAEDVLLRENYDFALSRAVASLDVLAEISLAYVKIAGKYLVLKGINSDEEIQNARNSIEIMGGEITKIIDYTIPNTDTKHRLIEITKIKETPAIYPRTFARIKKKPL